MPRPRSRSGFRSGTQGRAAPRRMFWETNSIVPTTITSGTQTVTDLMDGIRDRSALRRATIKRLILELGVQGPGLNARVQYGAAVFEVTFDAFTAGAIPDVGADEVGMYLAADGMSFDTGQTNVTKINTWDLRTARHLRGEDRTLVFSLTNQGIGDLTFSLSFRSLIAYG